MVLLGSFGAAYVVGHSTISLPLRKALAGDETSRWRMFLVTLLECPACFSFHVGFDLALFALPAPAWVTTSPLFVLWALGVGFVCSGFNFVLGTLTRLIG